MEYTFLDNLKPSNNQQAVKYKPIIIKFNNNTTMKSVKTKKNNKTLKNIKKVDNKTTTDNNNNEIAIFPNFKDNTDKLSESDKKRFMSTIQNINDMDMIPYNITKPKTELKPKPIVKKA